ncbi:MAG: ATP synthase F0 subunit B [Candidatus Taylorbacteria bacterium]|nr:ATP synthase F0 subunit B [Candidatus Taylorbacteria bacterium]
MASIISTFHIDWQIIVAQAINFVIVFAVLYIFVLKPLNKLMAERSEKIAKGVHDARQNAEMLALTKTEHEAIILKAKSDAQAIFQDGRKKSEAKRAEMLEEAKADVEKLIANGKKTLEAEKVKMVEEARMEVSSLVVEATKKILEKRQDDLV